MAESKDYAVVVGVNHYKNLQPLEGPDKDANEFYQWALSAEGANIPEGNCFLILSKADSKTPIQDDIDDCFGEIFNRLVASTNGGRLFFYFSGHGLGITWDETALVLPKYSNIMRDYALSSTGYLDKIIEGGFFENIYFFLDCCRNRIPNIKGASPRFGNARPAAAAARCDSLVCYSTEFDNAAYEAAMTTNADGTLDNTLVRGLFTRALMSGLKGGAAAGTGTVTVQSLVEYIESYLPELAKSLNKKQVPRFDNKFGRSDKKIIDRTFVNTIKTIIRFRVPGYEATLEDGDLKTVYTGTTDADWNLDLLRGNYCLILKNNGESIKPIRVDGSQNPCINVI
jgi:hypothetical protein